MTSDLELIEQLAIEGSHTSADKLQDLERTTNQREIKKAVRKALYRLSLAGIVPTRRHMVEPADSARADTLRAFASAFDGAGNRLILFLVQDPDGGAATLLHIRTNDAAGVENFESLKIRLRELDERVNRIKSQVETGLAVAEIEPDYGRFLLARSRSLSASLSKRSPAALLAWLGKIGEPAQDPLDDYSPPIYAHVTEEEIRGDTSIPTDPAELFKLKWFEPWFFAAEDTMPWLPRWEQAVLEAGDNLDTGSGIKINEIVSEAAAGLMTDAMRKLYVCRLEETADVLWLCGKEAEARQAVYHAVALKSAETERVADIPFVHQIAFRTLGAAFEMVLAYRERRAGG